jgi:CRAL/TRIO domain
MQQGVPVFVFRLASLTGPLQKELNAIPEDRRYKRMYVQFNADPHATNPLLLPNSIALHEFMLHFTLPFCSALPRLTSSSPDVDASMPAQLQPPPPITASTSIIDLGGVSLGSMWSLRRHLQQGSELATAHYPETIHQIAIVNAPTFFPTIWSWIKVRRSFCSRYRENHTSSPVRPGSMRVPETRSTSLALILVLPS